MVMKRSRRLQPVVRVAENRQQQAARVLGKAQAELAAAEQRLSELKSYREEYIRRFQAAGAQGMGVVQMSDYRQFLHRLSQAIEQQVQVVAQVAAQMEEQRRRWFTSRGKAQMLDSVVQRYQADEQREADRKEQGELDDRPPRANR